MSWRDWYPNVKCFTCQGVWRYDEVTLVTNPDTWDNDFLCPVCIVVRRLEGTPVA